ncbi:MAG: orotidine-5'-phosphate decarboxylase [Syntrophomonadaceae bacterium]|nr:orotidine-5'-phosphate decarboxylase [Syntrophomonadaceae bacterium]
MSLDVKQRLIVALDVDTRTEAERLVEALEGHVGAFKVGMQLYDSEGPEIVRRLMQRGGKVFVDLKFHDIPNTVAQAGRVMTRLGVFMYNLHVAGGQEMMRQTVAATHEEAKAAGVNPPLVLGVTVLTSITPQQLREEIGIDRDLTEQVVKWAKLAQKAGLDGVVASPQEIRAIRQACGPEFLIVTPGVRPAGSQLNDQKRVMTPGEAIAAGASYLVVGRPITEAADPAAAARAIVQEMEKAGR